eukprot:snap_masked-scaffold120_size336265-processed-gene-2.7 protein:Tk08790 transcript:snap_masked-scaffold120_size336265-processed-gene-2.7-mRNA-1 annotation:"dopamine receptor"
MSSAHNGMGSSSFTRQMTTATSTEGLLNWTISCDELALQFDNDSEWVAKCAGGGGGGSIIATTTSLQIQQPQFEHIFLFLLLLSFCLATVVGNILVVLAVLRERSLHTATNYFITSLAVADCLVGLVVMPFSAAYEAMGQQWIFGPDLCDAWHSLDVLASTASILNLCVISLDRYWAITDPMSYPFRMSNTRASLLILLVWVCSSAISFPAIAWWRATATGPPPQWQCPFTEDTGYLVFSSIVSFYGPLAVMVFTYFRIYRAALKHTRSLQSGCKVVGQNGELTIRIHKGGGAGTSAVAAGAAVAVVASQGGQFFKKGNSPPCDPLRPHESENSALAITNGFKNLVVTNQKKNFFSKKLSQFAKEKKAAKTLGTVMGVFIICWLPFFLTNVISGIWVDCIPAIVFQVVNWLGWINSSMNPVIYACFSRDFRRQSSYGGKSSSNATTTSRGRLVKCKSASSLILARGPRVPLERMLSDQSAKSLNRLTVSPQLNGTCLPTHSGRGGSGRGSSIQRHNLHTYRQNGWWMEPSEPRSLARNPLVELEWHRNGIKSGAQNSLYTIPPLNFDPQMSSEKLDSHPGGDGRTRARRLAKRSQHGSKPDSVNVRLEKDLASATG